VRLFEEAAAAAGLRTRVVDVVHALYEEAAETGWDQADLGAVVELLRTNRH
jgi:3-hydroxyisobutyrate dehydrogenase-like beta-hydroxyacid dehydrogenase